MLGVAGRDVAGDALVEAEAAEQPERRGEPLLAVLPLLLDRVELRQVRRRCAPAISSVIELRVMRIRSSGRVLAGRPMVLVSRYSSKPCDAVLAAEAALLVAAERRVGAEPLAAVHRRRVPVRIRRATPSARSSDAAVTAPDSP